MNLYTCTRCTLSEDQDTVQDPDRKIGLVLHLIWPYEGTYAKNRIYLCLDCMQEVKEEVLKMREYYEDMAEKARVAVDISELDHDCDTVNGQGFPACATITKMNDGFCRDV